MNTYVYEDPQYVQFYLDNLQEGQEFTVIFMTQGEEQRRYTGTLIPSNARKECVAFQTLEDGIKSFSVHRVLYIGE